MRLLFGVGGSLCLLYYIIIALYSGVRTSFSWVWLIFAAVCWLMFVFELRHRNEPAGLPRPLPVAVFTSFFAGLTVFLFLMFPVLRYAATPAQADCDYVVVLGAKVYPDRLSSTLRNRLDRAYDYYLKNPGTVFVLSGGQGRDEPVPEAFAMYNHLYRRGIPSSNLRMEIMSQNTEENIRFSRSVIEEDAAFRYPFKEDGELQIGILTNDFHLYRAIGIARKENYGDPVPISAPSDPVLFLHLCVRESAAILKDHILGHLSLRPLAPEPAPEGTDGPEPLQIRAFWKG